jgi:hypothetical protein
LQPKCLKQTHSPLGAAPRRGLTDPMLSKDCKIHATTAKQGYD